MDDKTKQAIKELIDLIDGLAASRRNISMESFADYHEINLLRTLIKA
jgi:hypothetical protein